MQGYDKGVLEVSVPVPVVTPPLFQVMSLPVSTPGRERDGGQGEKGTRRH